jgi:hypothetical protein
MKSSTLDDNRKALARFILNITTLVTFVNVINASDLHQSLRFRSATELDAIFWNKKWLEQVRK